ncbi:ATP-binding cassette domain-containing protein [Gordonia sp. LSe1-13]|uniref:ATP-binding cassette domain-containing protein n=1 Tax=Gordonia sesuvii TaxID=3116777 RepID=A0ABU7MAI7_9ACTN|nr:ATP-binding cassette domain-containing protein [Gordonia sp. LSe1-13]
MSLTVRGLVAGRAKVPVVRDLDIDAPDGTVLAVLGPNGAGKSTLMLTLAGLLPRLGGEVAVDGNALSSGNPLRANRSGVVLVPDNRALFTGLTVADNVSIARRRGGMSDADVQELFPALEARWKGAAGSLSGGEQQMLAVARALVQKPSVLLIDELSMGLAPVIVESLLPMVRRIADTSGATVVLVEQHVRLALEVADDALVLVHGEVTLRGSARDLRRYPDRLRQAYFGGEPAHATS